MVAVYASRITCLKLNKFIFVDLGPDTADFSLSAFGPYLAAFTNLETLHLASFELEALRPQKWPQPAFKLTRLSLSVAPGPDFRLLDASDLAWLAHSSRHSLRHLTLEGHSHDAMAKVAEWGAGLRTLALALCAGEALNQLETLAEVARTQELKQLKLDDDWGDSSGVRTVAAEVNRRVGREVAVVD